jgi:aryl-alcohol dehydrogenase-like predicted oxidoreductase
MSFFSKETAMEYTRLGSTGMKVSRICLGCMGFGDAQHWVYKWVLDEENSRLIIQKALELGFTASSFASPDPRDARF